MHAAPATTPTRDREAARLADLRALDLLDTPPEERFDRLTRLATDLFGVPIAYVALLDEHRQWLKSAQGWAACQTPRRASICQHALAENAPLIVADTHADERLRDLPVVAGPPHIRFYAGYPLRGPGGHVVGTFCIADERPRTLSGAERQWFERLGGLVEHELRLMHVIDAQQDSLRAQAEVERAYRAQSDALRALIESRRQMAEELQQAARYVASLLPPPLDGPVRTEWVFIPSAELGGDALGYHWLDDDHFAFYLLDVSGHGIGPALHSISVLNVLRAQTLRDADFYEPSSVLEALNEAFQMQHHNGMFLTIWYGVFDRRTRQLTYATGGHPPALLVTDADDRLGVERLRTPGLLVGGRRGVRYRQATRTIPPGGTLYVFSDGVYEVPRADGSKGDLDDFVGLLTTQLAAGEERLPRLVARINEIRSCQTCSDDFALLRVDFE